MYAKVPSPQYKQRILDHTNDQIPLVSHFKKSPAYASRLEADSSPEFYANFGNKRGRWELNRADKVILLGDLGMISDFALRHRDSWQRISIEIMDFSHTDYLRRMLETLKPEDCR